MPLVRNSDRIPNTVMTYFTKEEKPASLRSQFIYLFICLFIYLSIYLFVYSYCHKT